MTVQKSVLPLAAVIAGALTACGGSDDRPSAERAPDGGAVEVATEPAMAVTEVEPEEDYEPPILPSGQFVEITAAAETERVGGSGDAADDPAIWIASDPADSLLLGTDKTAGLYVYDLDGRVQQFVEAGRLNNVDLRGGFDFDGKEQVLVAATDRSNIAIRLFLLDPDTRKLRPAPGGSIPLDVGDPYGVCMWRAPEGAFHVAATGKDGEWRQFAISSQDGQITSDLVRRYRFTSIAEGCVADQVANMFFVGEENRGIWRFDADPTRDPEVGVVPEMIAPVDDTRLTADVEGLTIYRKSTDEAGYLIASSQGDSTFAVFSLPTVTFVGRVAVVADARAGIDGVTETDGIDATAAALPGYPEGLLVVQDDADDIDKDLPGGGQNFKLIDWRDVAAALDL